MSKVYISLVYLERKPAQATTYIKVHRWTHMSVLQAIVNSWMISAKMSRLIEVASFKAVGSKVKEESVHNEILRLWLCRNFRMTSCTRIRTNTVFHPAF